MTHIYIPKSSDMWCIHHYGSTEVNMHLDFYGPLSRILINKILPKSRAYSSSLFFISIAFYPAKVEIYKSKLFPPNPNGVDIHVGLLVGRVDCIVYIA